MFGQFAGEEALAFDGAHGGEHPLVLDSALLELLGHHFRACC